MPKAEEGFIIIDYALMSDILTKYGHHQDKEGEQLDEKHRIEVVELELDEITKVLTAHIHIITESVH